MGIGEAFRDDAAELAAQIPPDRRKEILATWHTSLQRDASDFYDLLAKHPRGQEGVKISVQHFMDAYLCGMMAPRGWVTDLEARQAPFMIGRALRDHLRGIGIPIDTLKATLGTAIDKALASIVDMGKAAKA